MKTFFGIRFFFWIAFRNWVNRFQVFDEKVRDSYLNCILGSRRSKLKFVFIQFLNNLHIRSDYEWIVFGFQEKIFSRVSKTALYVFGGNFQGTILSRSIFFHLRTFIEMILEFKRKPFGPLANISTARLKKLHCMCSQNCSKKIHVLRMFSFFIHFRDLNKNKSRFRQKRILHNCRTCFLVVRMIILMMNVFIGKTIIFWSFEWKIFGSWQNVLQVFDKVYSIVLSRKNSAPPQNQFVENF